MIPLAFLLPILAALQGVEPGSGSLPVFIENRGQWETPAQFIGRFPDRFVRAEQNALVLQLFQDGVDSTRGAVVRLEFEGAADSPRIEGLAEKLATYSFFLGDDPAHWQAGLPSFSELIYRDLYPGLDLRVHGIGGRMTLDVRARGGADASALRIRCVGAEGSRIDAGALGLRTAAGNMTLPLGDPGMQFRSLPDGTYGIEPTPPVVTAAANAPPTVDSKMRWSTYLGSSSNPFGTGDLSRAVEVGANGDVYVAGFAAGPDFPATPGAFQSNPGLGGDTFVARLRGSDGALVFSSVLGGSDSLDRAYAVAVGPTGAVTVAGETGSQDFPTTPFAFRQEKPGLFVDAFVFRLNASGSKLVYSTYLGGSYNDIAYALDVSPTGAAVVGGITGSPDDFPTTAGAYLRAFTSVPVGGTSGGFVTRLDPTGSSLEWSTLLASPSGGAQVTALTLDPNEDIIAVGYSISPGFPTTPGAWTTGPSPGKTFTTRLHATGSALVWSSVFGGSKINRPTSLALGQDGSVFIGGYTDSSDFPTTAGALRETFPKNSEAGFVVRLDRSAAFPIYSTYLDAADSGGAFSTRVLGISVDSSGSATLGGATWNGFVTTPGSLMPSPPASGADSFVSRLDPLGTKQLYASFIGGTGLKDSVAAITQSPMGTATITGSTSGGYPVTPNAYDPTFNGGQSDVFLTTFDLLPDGVTQHGKSTPSCRGPLIAGVTEMPNAGSASFAFTCSGAPPLSKGWLQVGSPQKLPSNSGGLAGALEAAPGLPVQSDADGWVEVPYSLTSNSPGDVFVARFMFANTPACPCPEPRSTSNVLRVKVQ